MNLTLFNRDVLAQIPGVLNELDQLTARINLVFDGATQTTVGAAGGASALPATPTGYFVVTIDGVERAVPYYAKS
jgi:hypothetical protein